MKIMVPVKPVIDPSVKIRIRQDKSGVEKQNVKLSINPFDEIALEEALRLREQQKASEIIVVSIGSLGCQEILRHALALGADRAIFISTEKSYCSLNIAKIFQELIQQEAPELVLMGKQSIDADSNQTPQMLAGLMSWPQATYASKIELSAPTITVTREIDGGLETLKLTLPAVVSVDLRLNTPRYASLPNIMKSKSKPLKQLSEAELKLNLKEHQQILSLNAPKQRVAGLKLDSVKDLVDKLKHEAKVL